MYRTNHSLIFIAPSRGQQRSFMKTRFYEKLSIVSPKKDSFYFYYFTLFQQSLSSFFIICQPPRYFYLHPQPVRQQLCPAACSFFGLGSPCVFHFCSCSCCSSPCCCSCSSSSPSCSGCWPDLPSQAPSWQSRGITAEAASCREPVNVTNDDQAPLR